jgi:hypothetical protein
MRESLNVSSAARSWNSTLSLSVVTSFLIPDAGTVACDLAWGDGTKPKVSPLSALLSTGSGLRFKEEWEDT